MGIRYSGQADGTVGMKAMKSDQSVCIPHRQEHCKCSHICEHYEVQPQEHSVWTQGCMAEGTPFGLVCMSQRTRMLTYRFPDQVSEGGVGACQLKAHSLVYATKSQPRGIM